MFVHIVWKKQTSYLVYSVAAFEKCAPTGLKWPDNTGTQRQCLAVNASLGQWLLFCFYHVSGPKWTLFVSFKCCSDSVHASCATMVG